MVPEYIVWADLANLALHKILSYMLVYSSTKHRKMKILTNEKACTSYSYTHNTGGNPSYGLNRPKKHVMTAESRAYGYFQIFSNKDRIVEPADDTDLQPD